MNCLRLPIVAATLVVPRFSPRVARPPHQSPRRPAVPSATAPLRGRHVDHRSVGRRSVGIHLGCRLVGRTDRGRRLRRCRINRRRAAELCDPQLRRPELHCRTTTWPPSSPRPSTGSPSRTSRRTCSSTCSGSAAGTQAQIQQLSQSLAGFGIDLNKLSGGSAEATVGGEDVELQALRAPGGDASQIVTHYNEIAAVFGQVFGNAEPTSAPTMTQASVGGKNVTVATDADGNKTYLYANGDTLWIVDNMTDDQAGTILGALQ